MLTDVLINTVINAFLARSQKQNNAQNKYFIIHRTIMFKFVCYYNMSSHVQLHLIPRHLCNHRNVRHNVTLIAHTSFVITHVFGQTYKVLSDWFIQRRSTVIYDLIGWYQVVFSGGMMFIDGMRKDFSSLLSKVTSWSCFSYILTACVNRIIPENKNNFLTRDSGSLFILF